MSEPGSAKKHKKHKKHKHKKHHSNVSEDVDINVESLGNITPDEDVDIDVTSPTPPGIKLKIKLGGETMGMSTIEPEPRCEQEPEEEDTVSWEENKITLVKGEDVFMTKKAGEDTSDEEREWLKALEAGTLDDSGAIKKSKDPKLMTARQRSAIHGPEELLMQLPSGYKNTELTEEQLKRKQVRAKKRREQAYEKQEKDKKQTVDRLLKKQESKFKSGKGRKSRRAHAPAYRYTSSSYITAISVPLGFNFPFTAKKHQKPRPATLCAVDGCKNQKKYNCSKTGLPLCSLQCYRTNLAKHVLQTAVTT